MEVASVIIIWSRSWKWVKVSLIIKWSRLFQNDKNRIIQIWAILKNRQLVYMRRKKCLLFWNISSFQRYSSFFKICKLAKTVMMSYTQPNFDQIRYSRMPRPICFDQKCYIFYSKILWELQYALNIFVTMATYRVPDLPHITGFSDHLKHSILIFTNGASSAWFS